MYLELVYYFIEVMIIVLKKILSNVFLLCKQNSLKSFWVEQKELESSVKVFIFRGLNNW
jgi:hypothetical protein